MINVKLNEKIVVASDIHGSFHCAKQLLDRVKEEEPKLFVLTGDLYYHGPRNPFPAEYNAMQVSQLLNNYKGLLRVVKGNCDSEVDEMISAFKMLKSLEVTYGGRKVLFTHGHKINCEKTADSKYNIIVFGHEHLGYFKQVNNQLYINVGSVSLPKSELGANYLVICNGIATLKSVESGEVLAERKL